MIVSVRRASSWNVTPLVLVVVALVGSVAIPARQTWRISTLLRETTQALAPARLLATQLYAGVAEELSPLRTFSMDGDPALLNRYRAIEVADDRRLDSLERLAPGLDSESERSIRQVRLRLAEWREIDRAVLDRRRTPVEVSGAVQRAQARYEQVLQSVADLSSNLAAETVRRDNRVRDLEHASLIWNAALVVAAFAALSSVMSLTIRERRALQDARRRGRREGALREAAEAFADAFTFDEVMDRIVRMALQAVEGRGAYIEQIVAESSKPPEIVIVRATAGTDTPPIDATHRLEGSHTSRVAMSGIPVLVPGPTELRSPDEHQPSGSVIVVPLGTMDARVGALFVLSPSRGRFRADDVEQAATFGHLASLALEKVRILDAANEGRRKLERVLKSRSRLIRGFSHDVKNPVGAADGYAALLGDGIYGELSAKQLESVKRIRRSIHGALALIDDLHELASAETGKLALTIEPVDIDELLITMVEEYQAAAGAGGLALIVATDGQLPSVATSRVRVQQIVSNLLSNAIKYTSRGSVTVGTRCQSHGPAGAAGDWVQLSVIDTGPGIPAEKQEYIFEEFSRIGPRDKSGAGLGLAISRLLAQALGGQLSVDSVVGNGSTFTLWLPLNRVASVHSAPHQQSVGVD